jgi:hypothetical protein
VVDLVSGDRGVDGARNPDGGFGDEALEEGARGGANVVAALGMPLDTEDEVGGGAFGGLAAFDAFDDSILRAPGRYAEAVTRNADGLMVAGVDWQTKEAVLFGRFFVGEKAAEEGFGRGGGGVRDGYLAPRGVVDRENVEVLNQSPATPDVEDLDAEADGEDWLIEVVGILEEELIDVFARVVGRGALGDGVLAIFVRVDVSGTAGKKDGLAGVDEVRDLDWRGEERDFDRFAATALDA